MHVYSCIHTESLIHVCCVHINHIVVFSEGILWCTSLNQMLHSATPVASMYIIWSIKVKMPPCQTRLQHTCVVASIPTNINMLSSGILIRIMNKRFCWGTTLLLTCWLVRKTASWPQLAIFYHTYSYISKIRQVTSAWIVDVGLMNGWRKICTS